MGAISERTPAGLESKRSVEAVARTAIFADLSRLEVFGCLFNVFGRPRAPWDAPVATAGSAPRSRSESALPNGSEGAILRGGRQRRRRLVVVVVTVVLVVVLVVVLLLLLLLFLLFLRVS